MKKTLIGLFMISGVVLGGCSLSQNGNENISSGLDLTNTQPENEVVVEQSGSNSTKLSNVEEYFKNYNKPIDVMFKNVLLQKKLDFIIIPDHIQSKVNGPYGAIGVDGGYRFTIGDKDAVCEILKIFNRSDLSCYDEENGASVYFYFNIIDKDSVELQITHYIGMGETVLIEEKYQIKDLMK